MADDTEQCTLGGRMKPGKVVLPPRGLLSCCPNAPDGLEHQAGAQGQVVDTVNGPVV